MFSNPVHRKLMQMVDTYFDYPSMQKVKDQDMTSIYMCRLSSLLLNENRYLVAITTLDEHPVGHLVKLGDLHWKYFQSRTLSGEEYVGITQHSYMTKRDLTWPVVKIRTTKEYSIYESETYPIHITLLHTSKDEYEYPLRGTFASCLETFQTIIRFIDE